MWPIYGSTPTEDVTLPEYARRMKCTLEGAYSRVREHMGAGLDRQKELYDRRVHGEELNVEESHNPVVNKTRGGNSIAHGRGHTG